MGHINSFLVSVFEGGGQLILGTKSNCIARLSDPLIWSYLMGWRRIMGHMAFY